MFRYFCGIMVSEEDERYMRRALELARAGRYDTSPNPMVGAVVVCDGMIVGEGFHRRFGKGHAEVNAIESVREKGLLSRSTIYVTLEPCSHYGKTPPCAKLIIDSGIPRVVVGMNDPNERVAGRGVAMLRDAGVEVVTGVLEDECRKLNRKFVTAHTLHRPYITLKWAQSSDGYIDSDRPDEGEAVKFSTPVTSMLSHRLRATNDMIIVGANTMRRDRPSLTTRLWPGRDPYPAVFTRTLDIPRSTGSRYVPLCLPGIGDGTPEAFETTVSNLFKNGLMTCGAISVLVEGGANLLQQFIDHGLWDEARVETAPLMLGGGVKAPRLDAAPTSSVTIDGRIIETYRRGEG